MTIHLLICMIISLVLFSGAIVALVGSIVRRKNYRNIKQRWIRIFFHHGRVFFAILYLLSVMVFCIGMQISTNDPECTSIPELCFYAMMNTLKCFSVNLDIRQVTEDMAKALGYLRFWKYYIGLICFTAPVTGIATLLSIIISYITGEQIWTRYKLKLERKVRLFSCLNEQSLALACYMKNLYPNECFVFADTGNVVSKGNSNGLIERAKDEGFYCMHGGLESIRLWTKRKFLQTTGDIRYYFISTDDSENLEKAIYMMNKASECWEYCDNPRMYIFSQSDVAMNALGKISEKNNNRPSTVIVPYKTNTIYNLLFDDPLYNYLKSGMEPEELRIVIIGENDWAIEIFKAVLWCGQLPSKTLHITVIAENPTWFKQQIRKQIGELDYFTTKKTPDNGVPYCDIKIYPTERSVKGKRKYIEDQIEDQIKDTAIWFVCLDQEQKCMDMAMYLRQQISIKTQDLLAGSRRVIHYQVSDSNIADSLNAIGKDRNKDNPKYNCKLHAFGSLEEQYSMKNIWEHYSYDVQDEDSAQATGDTQAKNSAQSVGDTQAEDTAQTADDNQAKDTAQPADATQAKDIALAADVTPAKGPGPAQSTGVVQTETTETANAIQTAGTGQTVNGVQPTGVIKTANDTQSMNSSWLMELAYEMNESWPKGEDLNPQTEYGRRSSLAEAVHVIYKLYSFGKLDPNSTDKISKKDILDKWTKEFQQNNAQAIGRMEHIRWLAYMRTTGFSRVELEKWTEFLSGKEGSYLRGEKEKKTKDPVTKDFLRKRHLLMCPYDDIEGLSKEYKWWCEHNPLGRERSGNPTGEQAEFKTKGVWNKKDVDPFDFKTKTDYATWYALALMDNTRTKGEKNKEDNGTLSEISKNENGTKLPLLDFPAPTKGREDKTKDEEK